MPSAWERGLHTRGDVRWSRRLPRLTIWSAPPRPGSLVLGAPLLRFECSASEVSNKNFPVSSANWLTRLWRTPFCGRIAVCWSPCC